MPDPTITQPVLYTVIGGLCSVIVFLFRMNQAHNAKAMDLLVAHHTQSMNEAREERSELIKANRDLAAAVDRATKNVAQLMMTMFFLPPDFRTHSEAVLKEIHEAERARDKST